MRVTEALTVLRQAGGVGLLLPLRANPLARAQVEANLVRIHKADGFVDRFSYLPLVGNGGMGYHYNYYYYHSSIPY